MQNNEKTLETLPGDVVRQIMWRYADRYDLQMVVQSARSVARGPVAHAVAEGFRNSHDWNDKKNDLLKSFDDAGITALFMDPEQGGYIEGPKNMALALAGFEVAWVDGGAATSILAGNLGLSPIHERGTKEQKDFYMGAAVPKEGKKTRRAAFALTEPIPFVGVDTSVLTGKMRVVEWNDTDPIIEVDKRGRFITGMGFADIVTCAVETDDPRIKSSAMVIVEETDPGTFDRGVPTRKMVHQLSSTNDPVIKVRVPASRIIGGFTIENGVIVPNFSHGEVIDAVFKRTRVTVGIMTTAKLLSAIEPVIRYHRNRFRGNPSINPGSIRFDLGIQQKEDALHKLVDIWATGEAAASLGFAAARHFDMFDPMEIVKEEYCKKEGLKGRAQLKAMMKEKDNALELVRLEMSSKRDEKRYNELQNNLLASYMVKDALANVLCPATKLWNTGYGANQMRDAVSLMGGYGITEDCPGFLGHKWMDAQLEATYEGPETVQRRQISITMANEIFLEWMKEFAKKMRTLDKKLGGETVAAAIDLWLETFKFIQCNKDALGADLYHNSRHGVSYAMADALCFVLASYYQILDVIELAEKGPLNPMLADSTEGFVNFFTDLARVQTLKTAAEVSKVATELINGLVADASKVPATIGELKQKLDATLFGARLAKDRAAHAVSKVMIPEALDYPQ